MGPFADEVGLMHHFCTYFDHRYLPRGLALWESLRRHVAEFTLWVLCLDDTARETLERLALQGVEPISLEELEAGDNALLAAKGNRSPIEYYFTLTPSLLLFVFRIQSQVDMITYLDADLWFFSDPEPLFEELGEQSIAIIAHRFPPHLAVLEQNGIYNVGWLSFRRDSSGLACLEWWRERCIEWCYDRCEEGRFADQKYLDHWPEQFDGVVVLQHLGADLAPWNLARYSVSVAGDCVLVDAQPLIFFHFHGLKHMTWRLYDTGWWLYDLNASRVVRDAIYGPYIHELRRIEREIAPLLTELAPHGRTPGLRVLRTTFQKVRSVAKFALSRRNPFLVAGR